MSARRTHPLRWLATALTGLMAVAALPACSVLGGGGGTYEIVAYFPRAVSVFPSSDVRVLGLQAGTVKEVKVEGTLVKITLAVRDNVPLPADVHAALVPRSLIGERYVQLFPAWKDGQPKAMDGHAIGKDPTKNEVIVPVEPDEALAALKDFLDQLNPKGLGKLIGNIAEDLDGNGETLGSALGGLSDLVQTFADADQELLHIVDNFDEFTATLTTREAQLAHVLDTFAQATQVLANERKDLETLLNALANVARDGLDLVVEHSTRLRTDIETLTHVTQAIDVNLGAVELLLKSGPRLMNGIISAYNPTLRAINLRQSFSPIAANLLNDIIEGILGLPPICIGVPDTECPGVVISAPATSRASGKAVPATLATSTPVDAILGLLDVPTAPPRPARHRSFGDFVHDAAATLIGVGS